jgi:N-acetylglutamate synthase-like GNAT family acetyltransferase
MMSPMTTPNLQVRRATIEDLPRLVALWKAEGLPAGQLDKRFQEFQVVVAQDGTLGGALGLQIAGSEGHLHSEAFSRPEEADSMRQLLLQRVQIMMRNHGLFRAWTQLTTPFWHLNGFQPATEEQLAKLPAAFEPVAPAWFCLKLRDEPVGPALSIEKEFALFKEAEKQQVEKMYRQAKTLKLVATVIAFSVLLLILGSLALFFLRHRARQQGDLSPGHAPTVRVYGNLKFHSSRLYFSRTSWVICACGTSLSASPAFHAAASAAFTRLA